MPTRYPTKSPTPRRIPPADLQAWQTIYTALNGEQWDFCDTSFDDPCNPNVNGCVDFMYIFCNFVDDGTYRITQFFLQDNNLFGIMPDPAFQVLGPHLELLDLASFGNGNRLGMVGTCLDYQFCYDNAKCFFQGSGAVLCPQVVVTKSPTMYPPTDQAELVAWQQLYDSLDGPNWTGACAVGPQLRSQPCFFTGCVRCVIAGDVLRFTGLMLNDKGLKGFLDDSVFWVMNLLDYIDFSDNTNAQGQGMIFSDDCIRAETCFNPGSYCNFTQSGVTLCSDPLVTKSPAISGRPQLPFADDIAFNWIFTDLGGPNWVMPSGCQSPAEDPCFACPSRIKCIQNPNKPSELFIQQLVLDGMNVTGVIPLVPLDHLFSVGLNRLSMVNNHLRLEEGGCLTLTPCYNGNATCDFRNSGIDLCDPPIGSPPTLAPTTPTRAPTMTAANPCRTSGGLVPEGTPCAVPFLYSSIPFSSCISFSNRPPLSTTPFEEPMIPTDYWCPTVPIYNLETQNSWGFCDCSTLAPAVTPVPTAVFTTVSPGASPPTPRPTTSAPTTRSPTTTKSPTQPGFTFPPTKSPTTSRPSTSPTRLPTTKSPTRAPTLAPVLPPTTPTTRSPTRVPTTQAPTTRVPTATPTAATKSPTLAPTKAPTKAPTNVPTRLSTGSPTRKDPTVQPSKSPTTSLPTQSPTTPRPTLSPTRQPTALPSKSPTTRPSFLPTASPTNKVTPAPSQSPVVRPTASPINVVSDAELANWRQFYDALGGPNWLQCSNMRDNPCACQASATVFVQCTRSETRRRRRLQGGDGATRITTISLPNNNVAGTVPEASVNALSGLTVLDLQGNPVTIPPGSTCSTLNVCSRTCTIGTVCNSAGTPAPTGSRDTGGGGVDGGLIAGIVILVLILLAILILLCIFWQCAHILPEPIKNCMESCSAKGKEGAAAAGACACCAVCSRARSGESAKRSSLKEELIIAQIDEEEEEYGNPVFSRLAKEAEGKSLPSRDEQRPDGRSHFSLMKGEGLPTLKDNSTLSEAKLNAMELDDAARKDVPDMESLLKNIGLGHKVDAVKRAGVTDITSLLRLNDERMRQIGLNLGERVKLKRTIDVRKGLPNDPVFGKEKTG